MQPMLRRLLPTPVRNKQGVEFALYPFIGALRTLSLIHKIQNEVSMGHDVSMEPGLLAGAPNIDSLRCLQFDHYQMQ